MRFSYALVTLIGLANALPTDNTVEQRAADLVQRSIEDRGVADAAYLAEIDARAEGLKLEERKKKKNNATAKAAKAAKGAKAAGAAAAAAAAARSIDVEERGVADAAYLAEVDARAEGLHLEERKKKKNKNASANAAKQVAAAGAATGAAADAGAAAAPAANATATGQDQQGDVQQEGENKRSVNLFDELDAE